MGLTEAAQHIGIRSHRPGIWQQRAMTKGRDAWADRSFRPLVSRGVTDADKRERIVNLRKNYRLSFAIIACRVGVSTNRGTGWRAM